MKSNYLLLTSLEPPLNMFKLMVPSRYLRIWIWEFRRVSRKEIKLENYWKEINVDN
jgi:hypothetical protein